MLRSDALLLLAAILGPSLVFTLGAVIRGEVRAYLNRRDRRRAARQLDAYRWTASDREDARNRARSLR